MLVGVGAFGREVALATKTNHFLVVDGALGEGSMPSSKDPFAAIVAAAAEKLGAALDIDHYLATSAPTDARGPRCDVFVVADLGEAGIAPRVAPLALALASGLRRAYSGILRAGDGALLVCPLLFCPRSGDRSLMGKAITSFSTLLREKTPSARASRLRGRVYLVEDQSGKYLVSRPEMIRSFAAFLRAVSLPSVRDDDRGVRRLIEDDDDSTTFSTFGCASLVFDQAAMMRIASARLGREVLSILRASVDPAAMDIAALATPLVPDCQKLEAELEEKAPLLELLKPPTLDVPDVLWEDEPETITEFKFGSLFRARTEATLAAFQDDVERFQMDKFAASLEQRGKSRLEKVTALLVERVAALVAERPTGHARALLVLRDARTRARGYWEEVVRAIEAPELSPMPQSPLVPKLEAVAEAALYRPRTLRLFALGGLAGLISAFLLSGSFVSAYRGLLAPTLPFFDTLSPLPQGRLGFLFTPPMPLLLGAAASAYSTGYRLWKHRKRHHNWILEARGDLAQALARHVRVDLVGHYEKRLQYARLLWVQRILGRLLGRIEESLAALEATRAALADADRALSREEQEAKRALSGGGLFTSSALHAAVVGPDDIDPVYAEARPPEPRALAERWLRKSLEERPWTEAPFAAPNELSEFCRSELSSLLDISPFEEGRSALHSAAEASTRGFLRRLFSKLSPPLEVAPKYAFDAAAPMRFLFAPPEARRLVDEVLAEGGFQGAWEVRAISPDRHGLQLLVARIDLPLEALALATPEEP